MATSGVLPVSDAARALAKNTGINLSEVEGSGTNGRIVKADVDKAIKAAKQPKTRGE